MELELTNKTLQTYCIDGKFQKVTIHEKEHSNYALLFCFSLENKICEQKECLCVSVCTRLSAYLSVCQPDMKVILWCSP